MPLGFDSCGIFYIGGKAQVSPTWCFSDIDWLCAVGEAPAVADKVSSSAVADKANKTDRKLHPFTGPEGGNFPGQLWWSYRSVKEDETWSKKDFKARLTEMLEPTTNDDEYVAWFQQNQGKGYCPFLRIKQK